jgi:hypothetical protein
MERSDGLPEFPVFAKNDVTPKQIWEIGERELLISKQLALAQLENQQQEENPQ